MITYDDIETLKLESLSAEEGARRLLGCVFERRIGNKIVHARIVETEAYDGSDPASHSYKGKTTRNAAMFGPAGHLYVYFIYGLHYSCNVIVGKDGDAAGALIRAVEPLDNFELIEKNRRLSGVTATNGPGKLCQALGIDKTLDGHDLRDQPLRLLATPNLEDSLVSVSTRVGISKAKETNWRFFITGNRYVSKHYSQKI